MSQLPEHRTVEVCIPCCAAHGSEGPDADGPERPLRPEVPLASRWRPGTCGGRDRGRVQAAQAAVHVDGHAVHVEGDVPERGQHQMPAGLQITIVGLLACEPPWRKQVRDGCKGTCNDLRHRCSKAPEDSPGVLSHLCNFKVLLGRQLNAVPSDITHQDSRLVQGGVGVMQELEAEVHPLLELGGTVRTEGLRDLL